MFDFKYRKIEKQMNLPPEISAFKLLRKANLTREEHSIILTGMNFEIRATIYDDAEKALKKFKGSNRKAMNRNWSNQKTNPALKTKREINKYHK